MVCTQFMGETIKNKTIVGFKGYAFSSSAFHNQIRRIAQGTNLFHQHKRIFRVFVGIPSKAEQTKNTSTFTTIK